MIILTLHMLQELDGRGLSARRAVAALPPPLPPPLPPAAHRRRIESSGCPVNAGT